MTADETPVRVFVPGPFRQGLDYLPHAFGPAPAGARVEAPLGRRQVVAIVDGTPSGAGIEPDRLRPLTRILDTEPLIPEAMMNLLRWASGYYHHPAGDVCLTALPALLRQGHPAARRVERVWRLTPTGAQVDTDALMQRASRQAGILRALDRSGWTAQGEMPAGDGLAGVLARLLELGWVEARDRPRMPRIGQGADGPALTEAQREALSAIPGGAGFSATLLEGVTGSGKTEIYLALARRAVESGRQVLVLVPEIGLTPQLVDRFFERLSVSIAVLHSGLTDAERLDGWLAAREGDARVILGTRSAIFTPMPDLGLIVVDEEHDGSFKQQDGFRYSARDLAVRRAQQAGVPILLGTATPSLETLNNALQGRYHHVRLSQRVGRAGQPVVRLLDVRSRPLREGLSRPLLEQAAQHLEQGGQVLMFLNRRGFAPALLCHDCGWQMPCRHCDSAMTLHAGGQRLCCHHCGAQRPPPAQCERCGSRSLMALGEGTERIAAALRSEFPDVPMARFDRDSTARKGALAQLLTQVRSKALRLLVGTQMIAKGHDFPDLSLVGVVNADGGLFSTDFRAIERMAQLVTQVAGRAGRDRRRGEVIIQTHHPDHPLLQLLVSEGYGRFARALLEERKQAGLPPFGSLALLQAEARQPRAPDAFLQAASTAADRLLVPQGRLRVELWGPAPAPLERRAGRTRAHLLLRADSRSELQRFLRAWLPEVDGLSEGRRVRWALDVDPQDLT